MSPRRVSAELDVNGLNFNAATTDPIHAAGVHN
jgi:hypothetical protein